MQTVREFPERPRHSRSKSVRLAGMGPVELLSRRISSSNRDACSTMSVNSPVTGRRTTGSGLVNGGFGHSVHSPPARRTASST